jgi:hypothetical protein
VPELLHCQDSWDTSKVNSLISFLIYFINAFDNHQLISMIVNFGTPPRYIAMAAPDWMECVPTLCLKIRSLALP